ncbi:hypothetical protein J4476_06240 [Candidatus Woesearchaeota archaeon]|nr:MAG: hypothetical protein QT09_C0014G0027 [archaeon GW2011_AR18]MBS3162268.1 hypothetical protein [Candidatus Woesearchaeota archaeon]HIH25170.1 hypothetical protein [Nanoarchaeota archaeon]
MKFKNLVIILVLSVVLISCSSGSGSGGSARGVSIKFIEPLPSELSEGGEFSTTIQISNAVVNANGINGELCLRDSISDNYGGLKDSPSPCYPVNLPSASQTSKGGINPSEDVFTFTSQPYSNLDPSITNEISIIADFKYSVDTSAGAVACVKKPGANSPTIPSNCGTEQSLSVQQPDMPLKVAKILIRPSRINSNDVKLNTEITLSRAIQGELLPKQESFEKTSFGSADIDFNVEINGYSASCSSISSGSKLNIRSNENEKVIKCSTLITLNQDYLDVPVKIDMGYGFRQSVPGGKIKLISNEVLSA